MLDINIYAASCDVLSSRFSLTEVSNFTKCDSGNYMQSYHYLAIRLRAQDFYTVIVDEAKD